MGILILGMGKSGKALQMACIKQNRPFYCFDDKKSEKEMWLGQQEAEELIRTKKSSLTVAVSPGLMPTHPLVSQARKERCRLVTEIDCAFQWADKPLPPCVGVTGTNGKTTVVEFTAFAASRAGVQAETVGNIGVPLTERVLLDSTPLPDLFVVELSSFQLEYTKTCPLCSGAYLNFAPDHLDWHGTMEAYHQAKWSMTRLLAPHGRFIVHPSVPSTPLMDHEKLSFSTTVQTDIGTDGQSLFFKGKRVGPLPKRLQGKLFHDTENFLASFGLLLPFDIPYSSLAESWDQFEKGPHRIQLVDTIHSVSFWDDSKATNISSTEAAVRVIDGPIVLIAGGVHKGFPYTSWKSVFQGKVQAIVAIGQAKEAIKKDLSPEFLVEEAGSFDEAFHRACELVKEGGHVLLSPGCSSYDMFQNYKERGDRFQALVKTYRMKQLEA